MEFEFELRSLLVGGVVGLLLGALAAIAFSQPRIARAIGKIAAVAFIGAGGGLLCWGLLTIFRDHAFDTLEFGLITLYSPEQAIGWGAGLLAAGTTALVLALTGSR
ncbi:MAG: hypothetical protein KatS3mg111_2791 [Pirellulaceae bacterium]|nr:MAG: hypothetical protein KatS3mg111_2791 [Pirellulaceae bacterium]